jgi:hypothetical protein
MPALADTTSYYFALNGYMPIEADADSTAQYMYYLYQNKFGGWYLQRIEKLSDTLSETKFAKGASDAAAAWTARDQQAYDFPDVTFKDL